MTIQIGGATKLHVTECPECLGNQVQDAMSAQWSLSAQDEHWALMIGLVY